MTAAIVDQLRVQNAQSLIADIGANHYYMLIGDQLPYSSSDPIEPGTDTTPPQAITNTYETYRQWLGAYGALQVNSADVVPAIPNITWTSGTVYSQYDAYDKNLSLNPFYAGVSVSGGIAIYKCLSNAGGIASTAQPSGTSASSVSTPGDGYRWKYMYTITAAQVASFVTTSYIPVYEATGNNLAAGTIESYRVTNGGSGYTNPTYAVTITGDGSTAAATAYASGGAITHIEASNGGTNYTFANVTIAAPTGGGGTQATALANLAPVGGHGTSNLRELFARYVLVLVQFVNTESGTISVAPTYRQISIIKNPTLYGSTTVATAVAYNQTYKLTLSAVSGAFVVGEKISNGAGTHVGYVVEYGTSPTTYILTNFVNGVFVAGDVLTGGTSGSTGTIGASGVTNPGLKPYSGDLMYYENRKPNSRAGNQTDSILVVFEY